MRFISITKSINIRLDWANIAGTVLKAGTPISLTGVVANTADAVGILSQDVSKSDAVVAVVTEGTIDLGEIAASYGELDDAAISAMHGITFIDDGEPVAPSGDGGGLPDYSEANPGDVLTAIGYGQLPQWIPPQGGGGGGDMFVANMTFKEDWQSEADVEFDKTYDEIAAAFADGKIVVAECLGKGIRAVDKRELIDSSIVYQVTMMEVVSMGSTAYLVVYVYQLDSTNAVTLDGGFYTLTPAN